MTTRHPCSRQSRRPRRRARGFTLMETALATVIVGVGVLALIESQQAFLRSNSWSTHAATATYLANECRELMRTLPKHDPVTGVYIDAGGTLHGWGPEAGEVDYLDFDDIDDFDGLDSEGLEFMPGGTPSLDDGDQPGPIDAFGTIIPEILADGTVMLDANGNALSLRGWSQLIRVDKIHPFNTSQLMADGATIPADGSFRGVAVDRFPLRVSVTVRYTDPFDGGISDVATVTWIVP